MSVVIVFPLLCLLNTAMPHLGFGTTFQSVKFVLREFSNWGLRISISAVGLDTWPAPGSEDTELGVFMGPEVRHGEAEVHARVQA